MDPYRSNPHMGSRPTCQVYGKMGHSALTCYNRFNQAYQAPGPSLTTYHAMTTPSHTRDLNWYLDTGASHHVTSNPNKLKFQSEECDGPNQIQVGNGTHLAIKNIGTFILFQPNFILHNGLHVTKITKNLLSI
jgi:hypothetical protein